jgi:putative transposase
LERNSDAESRDVGRSYARGVSRPPRSQIPGGVYHVTTRGVRRLPIFLDDRDRRRFLSIVAAVVKRYDWICHAYCLMTTHYHLLVTTPKPNIACGMQRMNGLYAQGFNRRHEEVGHVFERRYHARLVEDDGGLLGVARYIVWNPVHAGLCRHPREWEWSSYRATVGLAPAPDLLAVETVLDLFSPTDLEVARARFRRFIDGPLIPAGAG